MSALAAVTAPVEAQRGPDFGPGGGPPRQGAEFFLARTGDLRLTDAQVIRLAGIARRAADRRRVMRASMDSLVPSRRGGARGDSSMRAERGRDMERMRARFDRDREQARVDLRDALAVLNPDQQAMAWEMASRGGPGARGARFQTGRGGGRPAGPGERRGPNREQEPRGQRPPQ